VLGIAPVDSLRGLHLKEGRQAVRRGEVVVGSDLLKRLHTGLGDHVLLTLRDERQDLQIVGVKTDVLLGEIVLPIAEVRRLAELEDQASGVFVQLRDAAQRARFDDEITRHEFVAKVVQHDGLTGKFMLILQDIRKLVLLVAAIALLVGVIFIAANLSMTMQDRSTELSTLWALGCGRRTALSAIAVEVLAQTSGALLFAAPTTWLLAGLINRLWSDAWFEQATYVSSSLVWGMAGAVLALTALAGSAAFWLFWRGGMLENLRARALQ